MQADIHPEYHEVAFQDITTQDVVVTRSTLTSKETIEVDGKTLPLIKVEISSASHPFYTGKMKYVDSAGRVEKFQKKYQWDRRKKGGKTEDESEG